MAIRFVQSFLLRRLQREWKGRSSAFVRAPPSDFKRGSGWKQENVLFGGEMKASGLASGLNEPHYSSVDWSFNPPRSSTCIFTSTYIRRNIPQLTNSCVNMRLLSSLVACEGGCREKQKNLRVVSKFTSSDGDFSFFFFLSLHFKTQMTLRLVLKKPPHGLTVVTI